MKFWLFSALFLLSVSPVFGSGADEVLGPWHTEGNSSELEIFKCGDKLCGKVVWLKNPLNGTGKDGPAGVLKVDRKNPDPAQQNRPILGLQVIEGLTRSGGNSWENGSCYDPASGNTYTCRIRLISPERLEVRGFIGIPLFGRTYTLTRKAMLEGSRKSGTN
jgi:uncharacterized protein (DUF2147 family)